MRADLRIGFMGTPEFSVPALEALHECCEVALVISQPDRRAGRRMQLQPSAVKRRALELGVPVLTPERIRGNEQIHAQVRDLQLDAMVVVAYGQILPQSFLDLPRLGCFNIHASLLPQLRGAAPIQRAITQGHERTGITIIRMDAGLDTGDMLLQRELSIGEMDSPALHDALSALGAEAICTALEQLAAGTAELIPQDHAQSTYAAKLDREEAWIDWSLPSGALWCQIRGLRPWPGTRTRLQGEELKILDAWPEDAQGEPGTLVHLGSAGALVACGHGGLRINALQLPGRKPVRGADIRNGLQLETGVKFG